MTTRQAVIAYLVGVLLLEAILLGGLALLGAGSDSIVAAYFLLLGGASFGGGCIITRYY